MRSSLPDLEQRRAALYSELANTDDFRRGSITINFRRCGKANCACADPSHPGHGPRHLWTRSVPGGKTEGCQLVPGPELDKVSKEVANYKQFMAKVSEVVEVNEAICKARPVGESPPAEVSATGPEKGGSLLHSKRSSRPS